jgi:hypothetical protein
MPGIPGTVLNVVPELKILFETSVNYDKDSFSPYVVWYSGQKRIAEEKVSADVSRMLWTVPDKKGFHTVRAEVFPSKECADFGSIRGFVKEISLAVSAVPSANAKPVEAAASFVDASVASGQTDNFITRHYPLWGELLTAESTETGAASLASEKGAAPEWLPYSGVYGLALGGASVYKVPDVDFHALQRSNENIALRFYFSKLRDGNLFNITLGGNAQEENYEINVSLVKNDLVFTVNTRAEQSPVKQEIIPINDYSKNHLLLSYDTAYTDGILTLGLSVGEDEENATRKTVAFPADITGTGNVTLGAERIGVVPQNTHQSPRIASAVGSRAHAIISELSVVLPAEDLE